MTESVVEERTSAPLSWSVDDGRLRVVLDRPHALNALTPALLLDLAEVLGTVAREPDVRVVTLEGAGERAFSSGFDIKVLAALGKDAHRGRPLDTATAAVRDCPRPTVALVRGHCLGAGFELAMSCDFRLCAPSARFAVPAISIGTVYNPHAIERIWRRLGPTVTREIFELGHVFPAAEAYRVGIVSKVIEADIDRAVAEWTAFGPRSVRAVLAHKQILDALEATDERGPEFWAPLEELRARSVDSRERAEAVRDFARKDKREDEEEQVPNA
jgi:enoyl-CoA hydratase